MWQAWSPQPPTTGNQCSFIGADEHNSNYVHWFSKPMNVSYVHRFFTAPMNISGPLALLPYDHWWCGKPMNVRGLGTCGVVRLCSSVTWQSTNISRFRNRSCSFFFFLLSHLVLPSPNVTSLVTIHCPHHTPPPLLHQGSHRPHRTSRKEAEELGAPGRCCLHRTSSPYQPGATAPAWHFPCPT
jgi:hypothetical protein